MKTKAKKTNVYSPLRKKVLVALVVVWGLLVTGVLLVVSFNLYSIKQEQVRSAAYEIRSTISASYEAVFKDPLVDLSTKRVILPDAKVSFAYNPTDAMPVYSYWGHEPEDRSIIQLTTRNATYNAVQSGLNDSSLPPPKVDCSVMFTVVFAKQDNPEAPAATVKLNDGRTLYAYNYAERNKCAGVWGPAYDDLLKMIRTAQAYKV